MRRFLLLFLCICCVVALVPAQSVNFLKNGDFANGMTNWTGSGQGANPMTGQPHLTTPKTENFNTTGGGLSAAFTILPGGNTNQNPNNPPYILRQKAVVMPTPMELHMDVCLTGPNGNAQGGHLKIKVAGVQMATWTEYSGSFTSGTYRRHLTFKFTPTMGGLQNVDIEIWRERYIWSWGSPSSHTPKMAIDNVLLAPAQTPVLYAVGERKIAGTLAIDMKGTANASNLILLGQGVGPLLSFPGVSGSLGIDITKGLWIFATGKFDATGSYKFSSPIPNVPELVGASLAFQGAEASTAGAALGITHMLSIYN